MSNLQSTNLRMVLWIKEAMMNQNTFYSFLFFGFWLRKRVGYADRCDTFSNEYMRNAHDGPYVRMEKERISKSTSVGPGLPHIIDSQGGQPGQTKARDSRTGITLE